MTTLPPQKREVTHSSATYTFASRPRAVQGRGRYRNGPSQQSEGPAPYGNIMYDRRIVRGNTYAQNVLPASVQPDPIEIQKQQEARRRLLARKKAKAQLKPKTPEAVEGRRHIDVQTELYLEELTDRVEEADVYTQTDAFLDRPPSPLFIPAKTGVDVATQILEGELFDFDIEVKPILEVLVGKTVEQALLEVMEEEELSNLRAQQRRFEEKRNAELVETQRLEEQERRHREEKERRMKQQSDVRKKEKETSEKIAARAFAQSYLSDLVPSVFGTLTDFGYFYDPVERDVEDTFMPWLMDEVECQLSKTRISRALLDSIIRETVSSRDSSYAALEDELQKRIKEAADALRVSMRATIVKEDGLEADAVEGQDPKPASDTEQPANLENEQTDGQDTEEAPLETTEGMDHDATPAEENVVKSDDVPEESETVEDDPTDGKDES